MQNSKEGSLKPHWNLIKDEYKLVSILGEGTFGQVIRAQQRITKEQFAIKCIKINITKPH